MTAPAFYPARVVKRHRASKAEMEERAAFLIDYADEHGPVTVRQLFYQAVVRELPGIEKDDSGYNKIQEQVLHLRREGRLDYCKIADATRWMRKPTSFDGPEDAIRIGPAPIAKTYGPTPRNTSRCGARRTP